MNIKLYLNEKEIEGSVPLRSLFFGEAVFETTRWKGKKPVFLEKHLKRLREGAEILSIPYPGDQIITKQVSTCYKNCGIEDAYVKICLLSSGSSIYYGKADNSSILTVIKAHEESKTYLSLCVSGFRRNKNSALTTIKSFNYLENVLIKREAISRGYDEAIVLNTDKDVAETSSSNLFWVRGRSLFTPSITCGILPGITRNIVIEVATELRYEVNEGKYRFSYLLNSDFAFLTNSSNGILYINEINHQPFQNKIEQFNQLKKVLYKKLGWE